MKKIAPKQKTYNDEKKADLVMFCTKKDEVIAHNLSKIDEMRKEIANKDAKIKEYENVIAGFTEVNLKQKTAIEKLKSDKSFCLFCIFCLIIFLLIHLIF